MSSLTATDEQVRATPARVIQPAWVRLMHWINALAMILMILSGWQIYNASPLFGFAFPRGVTLGGWLGGSIAWHFAVMWLLFANGMVYVAYGVLSRHFSRSFLPLGVALVWRDARAALRLKLVHRPGA